MYMHIYFIFAHFLVFAFIEIYIVYTLIMIFQRINATLQISKDNHGRFVEN